jgi:anti-sigma regulatory factor (Ser/Thr protein kinase)
MRTVVKEAQPVDAEPAEVPAPGDELWWTFPALPIHARHARMWLEAWLCAQRPGAREYAYEALIVFSELVTNSVLHGIGPVVVHARLVEWRLECEVTDRCAELPVLFDAEPEDEHHRGLSLVDALAANWWVRANADGEKTTGFLIRLGPADTAAEPDLSACPPPPWPIGPGTYRRKSARG